MRHLRVRDVMTTDVASVREGTPFKRIVQLMAARGVSAVPVLGVDDRVVGVVSEADLLPKEEAPGPRGLAGVLAGAAVRLRRAKATADVAGDLMSAPAVTVDPDAYVAQAARLLDQQGIKRLPVVNAYGRLVGIVSRRDLLRVFLRDDEDIRAEVVDDLLARALSMDPAAVDVEVRDGVVVLTGQVEQKSLIPILVRLTHGVDGVVDVVEHLTFAFDDTHISPAEPQLHGIIDELRRRS